MLGITDRTRLYQSFQNSLITENAIILLKANSEEEKKT